jgi:hypothetical protein
MQLVADEVIEWSGGSSSRLSVVVGGQCSEVARFFYDSLQLEHKRFNKCGK